MASLVTLYPLSSETMTPPIGAPVAHEVMVPLRLPHDSGVHDGNLNEAMRVPQLKTPFVGRYSLVNQKVHWSMGSRVMEL